MGRKLGCQTISITTNAAVQQVIDHLTEVSFFTMSCPASNSGTVYIGGEQLDGTAVSATSFMWQLTAGDSVSVELPKRDDGSARKLDLKNLRVIGSASDDVICFGHFNE